jgi:hypothetical protein
MAQHAFAAVQRQHRQLSQATSQPPAAVQEAATPIWRLGGQHEKARPGKSKGILIQELGGEDEDGDDKEDEIHMDEDESVRGAQKSVSGPIEQLWDQLDFVADLLTELKEVHSPDVHLMFTNLSLVVLTRGACTHAVSLVVQTAPSSLCVWT